MPYAYLHPVQYLALEIEGQSARMAYMDVSPAGTANGQTVLLLHGKNFSGNYWEGTTRVLAAAGYRVIVPDHIRSDNGSECVAHTLQSWLADHHVKMLYLAPGSPWQNGHVESFHGSLRDECLDRELMLSVAEARVIIEDYRRYYNEVRPHGGLGYRTPTQACNEAQALDTKVANAVPPLDPPTNNRYPYNATEPLTRSGPKPGTRSARRLRGMIHRARVDFCDSLNLLFRRTAVARQIL